MSITYSINTFCHNWSSFNNNYLLSQTVRQQIPSMNKHTYTHTRTYSCNNENMLHNLYSLFFHLLHSLLVLFIFAFAGIANSFINLVGKFYPQAQMFAICQQAYAYICMNVCTSMRVCMCLHNHIVLNTFRVSSHQVLLPTYSPLSLSLIH